MNKNFSIAILAIAVLGMMSLNSCKKSESSTTGWDYNDSDWGGFEDKDYMGQANGPGLTFIEGGTFIMGNTEQDVMYEHHNVPRRITVSSFYMDETEVRNIDYREYLYWLDRVFGADYKEIVKA
ncbi:MAG: formylglycine-generating enzyme family protein, partial [Chitinophagales bacterium]